MGLWDIEFLAGVEDVLHREHGVSRVQLTEALVTRLDWLETWPHLSGAGDRMLAMVELDGGGSANPWQVHVLDGQYKDRYHAMLRVQDRLRVRRLGIAFLLDRELPVLLVPRGAGERIQGVADGNGLRVGMDGQSWLFVRRCHGVKGCMLS